MSEREQTIFDDPHPHWFDLVFPWEEPRWVTPLRKRRWRKRHERIRQLEASLSSRWRLRDLPWDSHGF